jgi:DNA invertase Pin-like site-specific DNA recombinase
MVLTEVRRAIGYIRVSTDEQGRSGLGLEAQRSAIEAEARRRGWQLTTVYKDVASGRSTNGRPHLEQALKDLADRKADALIVTKLDRLSRSVVDFGSLLKISTRHEWPLVILDQGIDTSTAAGKMLAKMLITISEWEAEAISERTKAALAVARDNGVRLGRARMIDSKTEKRILQLRRSGCSFQVIADTLNEQGWKAPLGGEWTWPTIKRVVRRNVTEPVKTRARRVELN